MWRIEYLSPSRRQLKRLDSQISVRILCFMRERVLEGEGPYAIGKPLTGKWIGHRAYRVGDYRVLCQVQDAVLLVTVVKVGHRKDVYD